MPIALTAQGAHPSTELCLEALQWLQSRAECANILEIGCGNGILSVAAAAAFGAPVLAADISPNAVADANENIAAHGLDGMVSVIRADGLNHKEIRARAPYDLIIANLLPELHVRLAGEIRTHLAPGGHLLLAGSLAWLAEGVEQAYTGLGFELIEKFDNPPWHGTIFRG